MSESTAPFGQYEEEAITALILDHPEFFTTISKYLSHKLFSRPEVQYVIVHLLDYYSKYDTYPSRGMLRDIIAKSITVDAPYAEDILQIVNRQSDPRDIAGLKARLLDWAKKQAYASLWSKETIDRYNKGDYDYIENVFETARNIQEIKSHGFDFFNDIEKVFIERNKSILTTGIHQLDQDLDEGGPGKKEVLVWMAPTGVGKSLMLANNAISNALIGKNVLYITLELADIKSALRMLGALTNLPITAGRYMSMRDKMLHVVKSLKASKNVGDILIYEFPANEISVNHIYTLVDELKKSKKWTPDLIIIDYLELMVGRRQEDNKDDYTMQKRVTTQVRGLAHNLNAGVFTATQTNRSGNMQDAVLDVTKMAESYGKSMPIDYLVSISQSDEEYKMTPAVARLYIAKNRNGPKFKTIPIRINYDTMGVRQS